MALQEAKSVLFQEFMPQLQKQIGKEISDQVSKHFKDNQRVLINELRDCKAETGLTFSEVCKEKLAEFTNDATTRQIRMQHDLE